MSWDSSVVPFVCHFIPPWTLPLPSAPAWLPPSSPLSMVQEPCLCWLSTTQSPSSPCTAPESPVGWPSFPGRTGSLWSSRPPGWSQRFQRDPLLRSVQLPGCLGRTELATSNIVSTPCQHRAHIPDMSGAESGMDRAQEGRGLCSLTSAGSGTPQSDEGWNPVFPQKLHPTRPSPVLTSSSS